MKNSVDNNEKSNKQLYWSKKITCECGCIISRSNKYYHVKSVKHLKLIKPMIILDKYLDDFVDKYSAITDSEKELIEDFKSKINN